MTSEFHQIEPVFGIRVLRLRSGDNMNRLTPDAVQALNEKLRQLAKSAEPLIITGNDRFFSVGADLDEIALLTATTAYQFAGKGQELMSFIENFPAPVIAAVSGYCMGGGLDLALACHCRIASPRTIFAHRGAALGLMTGWGGTQRLPRLIGKGKALEIFLTAAKIHATEALRIGLVQSLADDPVREAAKALTCGEFAEFL